MASENTSHFIVATAGHVDHGKSSLVKALTGIDPDRLPEEKARGITIDLGFAHLQLTAETASAARLEIGLVDVPGHEDLVKNMVAGAGAIDLALLVVAADDGWMPQTEEHLQILSYLGIARGVVALTKMDLAEAEEKTVTAQLREKLLGSPFESAPIVPISVVTGAGLQQLRATIASVLADVPPARDIGKPRLPIDRVFKLQGVGTIVTGTLRGGCLQRGQEVILEPVTSGSKVTRLRSIQTFNREVELAVPGTRTALNLANVEIGSDPRNGADLVAKRGGVVTVAGLGRPSDTCELLIERSARVPRDAWRPLKEGVRIRFHLGTGNVAGRLHLFDRQELLPGDRCLGRIRLEAAIYAFAGDRFVLRDWTERETLAGGVVLDATPRRKHVPWRGWQRLTNPDANNPMTPSEAIAAQLERHQVIENAGLLTQSNFSRTEIEEGLTQASEHGQCALIGDFVIEPKYWQTLREKAQGAIDELHRTHPEQPGLSLAELHSWLIPQMAHPGIFELLLAQLLRTGFKRVGPNIKRASHEATLPPHLLPAGNRIRTVLALKPLEPPSRMQLAADRLSQEALKFLLRAGEVVEVGQELVLSSRTFARGSEVICRFLRQNGAATVSQLRQVVGASRRVVVPILEKLDREGVTRREGDKRILNE